MRKHSFERLPAIWHRFDTDGQLERYLKVFDRSIDETHGKRKKILTVRNIDAISDKWLPAFGKLVGHKWNNTKTYLWNRDRIRHAFYRYSQKGSSASYNNIVRDCGGRFVHVTDNASRLLVVGKQGRLSCDDSVIMDDQFWHDGSFVMRPDRNVNFEELLIELDDTLPAGTLWWFEMVSLVNEILEFNYTFAPATLRSSTNAMAGRLGYGRLGDDLFLSFDSNGAVRVTVTEANWHKFRDFIGIGYNAIGENLFISMEPNGETRLQVIGVHYHKQRSAYGFGIGYGLRIGIDLQLSRISDWFLTLSRSYTHQFFACELIGTTIVVPSISHLKQDFIVFGGYWTADSNVRVSYSIPVDMGTEINPLAEEYAIIQENAQITSIAI